MLDLISYSLGLKNGGGGITPTGSTEITENGEYDVTTYVTAVVNVAGGASEDGSIFHPIVCKMDLNLRVKEVII